MERGGCNFERGGCFGEWGGGWPWMGWLGVALFSIHGMSYGVAGVAEMAGVASLVGP